MNSPYDTAVAVGSPIGKFPDQSLLSSSPKHIAACHVLHRLLVPRHPPNALSSLPLRLSPYSEDPSSFDFALFEFQRFEFAILNSSAESCDATCARMTKYRLIYL